MKFLAVDLGTSFIKVAVVDVVTVQIRDVRRIATPARIGGTESDVFEIDPQQVLTLVRQLIDELLKCCSECQGILICGQMGGLILLDAAYAPVTPYISWCDRRTCRIDSRSRSCLSQLEQSLGDQKRSVLGNEFQPGLSLPLLDFIQQTQPQQLSESTIPVTLPDYISAALCQSKPVIEVTNSSGVVSIIDRCHATALIQSAGIPPLAWPAIVEFQHVVGEYRCGEHSIPVYPATGDHQTSLAGTLLQQDELSINIATGSQVSVLTTDNDCQDFQLRPFFDGLWLKTITNIPAGRALTAVLRLLTEVSRREPSEQDWDYFFSEATKTESSDVNVNLGLFPGAVVGPGSISNLTEANLNVGHIARASLQQMAQQYQHFASLLDSKRAWNQVALSGGLARRSPLLRQLVSDSLSTPHRLAPTDDDALFGLLLLGRVISGIDGNVTAAIQSVKKQVK